MSDTIPQLSRDRLPNGRFAPANTLSIQGGHARAAVLDPDRRREIARSGGLAGFRALVDRYFDGDLAAAKAYIAKRGAWAAEHTAYAGTSIYHPFAFPHPGPLPAAKE
jgi:hypothetical protein